MPQNIFPLRGHLLKKSCEKKGVYLKKSFPLRATEILRNFVAYTIAVFHHSSLPTAYRTNHSTSSLGTEGLKYYFSVILKYYGKAVKRPTPVPISQSLRLWQGQLPNLPRGEQHLPDFVMFL